MIEARIRLPGEVQLLTIERLEGGTHEDDVNVYRAYLQGRQATYTHRYGDGWVRCVELGLRALRLFPE